MRLGTIIVGSAVVLLALACKKSDEPEAQQPADTSAGASVPDSGPREVPPREPAKPDTVTRPDTGRT